jgi:hypothetical protein
VAFIIVTVFIYIIALDPILNGGDSLFSIPRALHVAICGVLVLVVYYFLFHLLGEKIKIGEKDDSQSRN